MTQPRLQHAALFFAGACLSLAWAACGRSRSPAVAPFEATRVFPSLASEGEPLLLNDAITVYFSEPVDPLSVTPDSVAVVDREGHPVRGRLRTEGSYVTFEPEAPLGAELLDGSFLLGHEYRLVVHGYPRAGGVRSQRGVLLREGLGRTFRTASKGATTEVGASPLRPVFADSRPFLLRPNELGSVPLPIDDPRLQLHFTLPVLPSSATKAAFEITLLRRGASPGEIERIEPFAVRLLPQQPVDEFRGSTIELEFGDTVRIAGSDRMVSLAPEDFMGIRLVAGPAAVVDYAGRPAPVQVQWCHVVPGVAVTVAEWPTADGDPIWLDADLAAPGFEVTSRRTIQPLVRVEAGTGELGVLRPQRDLVLRPGQPFDPGDGVARVVHGSRFDFQAIDIPQGVTVRVQGTGAPVVLAALGRVRVQGRILYEAPAVPAVGMPPLAEFGALLERSVLVLVSGSGLEVEGEIAAEEARAGGGLALVTAGSISVPGRVPPKTILATERGVKASTPLPDGCSFVRIRLQQGLPAGTAVSASAWSPFAALPGDRGGSVLRIRGSGGTLRTMWQVAPHDPLQRGTPDLDPSRAAPARNAVDGQRIDAAPGSFLRLRLQAEVRAGEPLPELVSVRALDR